MRERNAFLTREMGIELKCSNCGTEWPELCFCECVGIGHGNTPINFSTWYGFGKLITWLKEQPLWTKIKWNMPMAEFMELAADPDKAAYAVYKYLKEG